MIQNNLLLLLISLFIVLVSVKSFKNGFISIIRKIKDKNKYNGDKKIFSDKNKINLENIYEDDDMKYFSDKIDSYYRMDPKRRYNIQKEIMNDEIELLALYQGYRMSNIDYSISQGFGNKKTYEKIKNLILKYPCFLFYTDKEKGLDLIRILSTNVNDDRVKLFCAIIRGENRKIVFENLYPDSIVAIKKWSDSQNKIIKEGKIKHVEHFGTNIGYNQLITMHYEGKIE